MSARGRSRHQMNAQFLSLRRYGAHSEIEFIVPMLILGLDFVSGNGVKIALRHFIHKKDR